MLLLLIAACRRCLLRPKHLSYASRAQQKMKNYKLTSSLLAGAQLLAVQLQTAAGILL
jgi:hypothetical protein